MWIGLITSIHESACRVTTLVVLYSRLLVVQYSSYQGHDFSRAVQPQTEVGFSPCQLLFKS